MASRLAELLKELGQNAELHDEYVKDPEGVMQRYDMSKEEIKAMLDKDVKKLEELSGLDGLKANGIVRAHDI
ncbi:hypothetical protein [Wenzhouxiangella marina]|uniref:Uncharacterized protein n=1 Tax=Wenzhouxiangella marina TaxID=1579979 RepID=A0A0K0XZ03_9GAMM|nr:hypothetical protein [Wenzhouxiangella marina]AKS42900.1 hypothetical protein WM2015_2542 [Wenzhouxiangella marina]MBB6087417.1 hypothetical protein [Wenzhouxiangella marina]